VTGGSGLVGIHTARRLAEIGQSVICYNRRGKPWHADAILGEYSSKVIFAQGNILDFKRMCDLVLAHQIEGIIHVAATVNERVVRKDPLMATKINVNGTANVLEIARLFKLTRVVYTSSATIYGRRNDFAPIKETEINPQNFYSETKYIGERMIEKYRNIFAVDTIIVRISSAYGPGKVWDTRQYPLQRLCWEAMQGNYFKMPEGGEYQRDFTYVRDTASGVCLAYQVQNPKYSIYNVACGRTYTLFDVAETLNKIFPHSKIEIGLGQFDNDFALRGSLRGPLDIQRSKEDFGFKPEYTLESGLKEYIDFLQENQNLIKSPS